MREKLASSVYCAPPLEGEEQLSKSRIFIKRWAIISPTIYQNPWWLADYNKYGLCDITRREKGAMQGWLFLDLQSGQPNRPTDQKESWLDNSENKCNATPILLLEMSVGRRLISPDPPSWPVWKEPRRFANRKKKVSPHEISILSISPFQPGLLSSLCIFQYILSTVRLRWSSTETHPRSRRRGINNLLHRETRPLTAKDSVQPVLRSAQCLSRGKLAWSRIWKHYTLPSLLLLSTFTRCERVPLLLSVTKPPPCKYTNLLLEQHRCCSRS